MLLLLLRSAMVLYNNAHAQHVLCARAAAYLVCRFVDLCVVSSSIALISSRKMDGGAFYRNYSQSGLPGSFVSQRGQTHSIPDHIGYDPPVAVAANVGINQKLDRVLTLIEEQKRETSALKSELANLRAEVDGYRSATSSISISSPTPAVTKLPLELSVS